MNEIYNEDDNSITSLLEDFGKELENQEAIDFIETFQDAYFIQPSNLCNQILAYLANKNIRTNKICLKTLEDFKQNYIKSENKFEDEPLLKLSNRQKLQTKPKLIELDFMDDYVESNKENLIENNDDVKVQKKSKPKIKFNYEMYETDDNYDCMFLNEYTLNKRLRTACQENLMKKFNLLVNEGILKDIGEFSELTPVGWCSKDDVYMYGKICVSYNRDFGDNASLGKVNKLTTENICLQSVQENDFSKISLNLDKLESYAFYPGQNVILKGFTVSKAEFFVQEILPNLISPIEPIKLINGVGDDLKLLIASNLSYNKKSFEFVALSLIEIAANKSCDAVILCGPFILNDIYLLMDCEVEPLDSLIKKINQAANRFQIHVVLVPNTQDVKSFNLFPQAPFPVPVDLDEMDYVHFCKNPDIITLQQYKFGICSEDILSEFGQLELSKNSPGRLNRFCRNMLSDASFCPLFTDNLNLDPELVLSKAQIHTTPHFLIVPSKINNFHETVHNTICINPGHAIKEDRVTPGTYCIIEIEGSKVSQPHNGVIDATRISFQTMKLV